VSNRGIGRARMFVGGMLLFGAVIAWATALMMSPHAEGEVTGGEHVRATVALFMRNSAMGTLVLCAIAAWLLLPARRPKRPARDWAIIGLIGLMVATSLYQLFWLRSVLY
jgi:hypothetical protein